jgi:phage terminase small subunit
MKRKSLTLKQRLFIVEYLATKNATKAAIRAGYSAKTARQAGSRLMRTNVDIYTAIENSIAEQLERAELSAVLVVHKLKTIAFDDFPNRGTMRALELLLKAFGLGKFAKEPVAADKQWSAADLLPPRYDRKE